MSNARQLAQSAVTPLSFKNRFINGACAVAQRASSAVTNSWQYAGADRFTVAAGTGGATGTIQRSALGGTSSGYGQFCANLTMTGGSVAFGQRLEANAVQDLNGKTITISGKYYQDTGTSFPLTISLQKPTAIDNHTSTTQGPSGTTASIPSGVLTPFSVTLQLGASDVTNGLQVQFNTPVMTVSGKNFGIGDIQLEAGSVASAFEFRPYPVELALCLRFYQVLTLLFSAYNGSGGGYSLTYMYPTYMRAAPTVSLPAPGYANASGLSVSSVNPNFLIANITITSTGSGLVNGTAVMSAEL